MKTAQTPRKKLGLSQDDMAVYFGVVRSHVSMIEDHKRSPSTPVLQKQSWLEIEIIKPNKQVSATVQQQMQQYNKKQKDKLSKLKANCLHRCTVQHHLAQADVALKFIHIHHFGSVICHSHSVNCDANNVRPHLHETPCSLQCSA
jgi:predicted transcriptional regulator